MFFSDTHQSEIGLARCMYLYDSGPLFNYTLKMVLFLNWSPNMGLFFTVFKQRKRPVSALSWIVRLSHFMGASLSAAPS